MCVLKESSLPSRGRNWTVEYRVITLHYITQVRVSQREIHFQIKSKCICIALFTSNVTEGFIYAHRTAPQPT